MGITITVSAAQEGNHRWCNVDSYGCWDIDEDGNQFYIMFWSESARAYFMGNNSAPYSNVTDFCDDCKDGNMGLAPAPEENTSEDEKEDSSEDIQEDPNEKIRNDKINWIADKWLESDETMGMVADGYRRQEHLTTLSGYDDAQLDSIIENIHW